LSNSNVIQTKATISRDDRYEKALSDALSYQIELMGTKARTLEAELRKSIYGSEGVKQMNEIVSLVSLATGRADSFRGLYRSQLRMKQMSLDYPLGTILASSEIFG
jgi:hypothetical protein